MNQCDGIQEGDDIQLRFEQVAGGADFEYGTYLG